MRVNPRMPLPAFGNQRDAESKAGSVYIVMSQTTATSNSAPGFLPANQQSYTFVASMLGTLAVFWIPLHRLLQFAANSEFSYIPLIPAISAVLVMIRRRRILSDP